MRPSRPLLPLLLFLCPLAGCPGGGSGGGSSEAAVAAFQQRLELTIDGAAVQVPLERLDIYLVEDESYPEIFELRGPGTILVGEFPSSLHVGYGEHWDQLVGKTITIAAEGGDPREPKHSQLGLPGGGALKVTSGTFKVATFSEGFDAKTPLDGEIELQLDDGRTVKGKLFVLGTTWG